MRPPCIYKFTQASASPSDAAEVFDALVCLARVPPGTGRDQASARGLRDQESIRHHRRGRGRDEARPPRRGGPTRVGDRGLRPGRSSPPTASGLPPHRRGSGGPATTGRAQRRRVRAARIVVRLHHEVTDIDSRARVVRVWHGGNGSSRPYDRLLIATRRLPVRPEVPRLDLQGVFHLDVMEDAMAIQGYLREQRPKRAVIVGGATSARSWRRT